MASFSKLDPDTQEEVILYVGESFNLTYKKRWASMDARSSKLSWNWATFFLSLPWSAYRKMYGWTYGYFAVTSLIDIFFWCFKHKEGIILGLFEFLAVVLFSVFSNYIYQQHSIKAVEKLKIEIPNEEQRLAYLRKKGGGSGGSVWMFFLIALVVGGIYGWIGIN